MSLRHGLRASVRLARVLAHVLRGVAIAGLRMPRLGAEARQAEVRRWAAGLLQRLGVALDARGAPAEGGVLLVANHVSWLDIVAVHAVCPRARFVSKADVRHWPVLNRLVDAAGTLYLQRERRRDAMRVVHHMGEALAAGDAVAVFPQGTTGAGPVPLPFHANLLQAAIATRAPVQPVALRFSQPGAPFSESVAFVGDTTLAESLWRVARAEGLTVPLRFLPPLESAPTERRALAEALRARIDDALRAEAG